MIQEDYLACDKYQNKPAHPNQSNFTQFFDEKNNLYYFAFVANDGTVLLKSEGYPQLKSCETGIASVVKNKEITERYAVKKGTKTFYLSLKAANNREIARSCDFKTEAEATAAIATISAPIATTTVTTKTKAVATKTTTPAKAVAAKKTTTKVEAVVKNEVHAAATEQNSVAPAAAKVTKTKTKAAATFLTENEYFGHENIWFGEIQTGYVKFVKNDSFYFAVYNPDGSLYLVSKAFTTEMTRNETFDKTVNCIENGELYSVKEIENKFFVTLLDEKENELARSAAFDTYTSAFVTTPIGRTKVEATLY